MLPDRKNPCNLTPENTFTGVTPELVISISIFFSVTYFSTGADAAPKWLVITPLSTGHGSLPLFSMKLSLNILSSGLSSAVADFFLSSSISLLISLSILFAILFFSSVPFEAALPYCLASSQSSAVCSSHPAKDISAVLSLVFNCEIFARSSSIFFLDSSISLLSSL